MYSSCKKRSSFDSNIINPNIYISTLVKNTKKMIDTQSKNKQTNLSVDQKGKKKMKNFFRSTINKNMDRIYSWKGKKVKKVKRFTQQPQSEHGKKEYKQMNYNNNDKKVRIKINVTKKANTCVCMSRWVSKRYNLSVLFYFVLLISTKSVSVLVSYVCV